MLWQKSVVLFGKLRKLPGALGIGARQSCQPAFAQMVGDCASSGNRAVMNFANELLFCGVALFGQPNEVGRRNGNDEANWVRHGDPDLGVLAYFRILDGTQFVGRGVKALK